MAWNGADAAASERIAGQIAVTAAGGTSALGAFVYRDTALREKLEVLFDVAQRHYLPLDIHVDEGLAVDACGLRTVCYNFMPVLDWTRTQLDYPVIGGARALRFNIHEYVAFDWLMLKRKEAERGQHSTEQWREGAASDKKGDQCVFAMQIEPSGTTPQVQHSRGSQRLDHVAKI